MPKKYKQLNIEEREIIQLGLWNKDSLRAIACRLSRPVSTVSREVKRNCGHMSKRRYTPRVAQERAKEKICRRGKRFRLKDPFIREYAVNKLKEHYSPEQIAGRLKVDYPECKISYEAIYQFIYSQYHRQGYGDCLGEDLRIYLKRRHKARQRKHVPFGRKRLKILDAVSITERPKEIDLRLVIGHWEGDSMVSRQSSIGLNTLVERKSGLLFITKIKNGKAEETSRTVISRLGVLDPEKRQTLTIDNGSENADHKEIARELGTACYFAQPYHSWERGTNENTNGLIRYYLPKRTDFRLVSDQRIKQIENILNNRPRKRLKWLTPLEVFNGQMLH